MMINAITTAFIYVLKAFFSLLTWFLKLFINAIKKFYVVLPVTSILFILLFFATAKIRLTHLNRQRWILTGLSET